MERNSTHSLRFESDSNHFSVKFIMPFLEKKMVHVVIDRYFSLYLKGLEDFS